MTPNAWITLAFGVGGLLVNLVTLAVGYGILRGTVTALDARVLSLEAETKTIRSLEVGMGENILILAFVVIIIGGIGSIRGAFVAAILVGLIDTIGRAFLPDLARQFLSYSAGSSAGPALSSMLIYTLMALVLIFRPEGLFPATSK